MDKLKSFAKQGFFKVITPLLLTLSLGNPLFAKYGTKTDPIKKVTSSYNCVPPTINLAAIQPVQSGLWNQASTWPSGNLPTNQDAVTVPVGITLTMVGTCRAKTITVQGKLNAVNTQAASAWIDLRTERILVKDGGTLEIGTENQPYIANKNGQGVRCQITLIGAKNTNLGAAYKAIMVQTGGTLELHGKKKMSWTNMGATANPGDTQITLKEPVDWEIGDVIALTSTALAVQGGKQWEQVDQVTIASISADKKTLTLTAPLVYKHIGDTRTYTRPTDGKTWEVNIQGEVGLLSHYIKIQGETSDNVGFGGHIMIMKGSTSHSENIELYRMGQKGVKSRYPYHWHLNEDESMGSYLKNSSIHKSFSRAVTIHGTDYVTVDGVFAYDHIGHGIFLEDGGERFNTIKNNVVFVTRRPRDADRLTPSDNELNQRQNRTPASFWITNAHNYFENNVAAGTEGTGFWIAQPKDKPLFESGTIEYYMDVNPVKEPLGKFDGFVAHTCMNGWDIFDQLNPDHSLNLNKGWDVDTNQFIENGVLYGNDIAVYCGLGLGGDPSKVFFKDCSFSDNTRITMLAANIQFTDCLMNADSDFGVFTGLREFHLFYDGPGNYEDCHFEGWDRSNTEMITQGRGSGATENFNPTFSRVTKGFSDPFPFRFAGVPNNDPEMRARKLGNVFKDIDGSLLGKPGTLIRDDSAFLRDGHEYKHASWNNAVRSDYNFAGLWFNFYTGDVSVERSKTGTDDVCFADLSSRKSGLHKFPLIVNQDFLYTFTFKDVPNTSYNGTGELLQLLWYRGDPGDMSLACFKGFGKLQNFRIGGQTSVNSLEAVTNATTTSYYIAGNGDVYINLRAIGGDARKAVNMQWDGQGSYVTRALPCTSNIFEEGTSDSTDDQTDDSDGDGYSDEIELANCRSITDPSDLSFDFNGIDENFEFNKLTPSSFTPSGAWELTATNSNDPFIYRSNLSFAANQVSSITVRIQSEKTGTVQLFWGTAGTNFSGDRVNTQNYTTANQWQEITFDVESNDQWSGNITALRLDFVADANAIVTHWIDWMRGPNGSDSCTLSVSDVDKYPLKLYPNPVKNTLFISGNTAGKTLRVYDLLGRVRATKTFNENENTIDLSNLGNDIYLIKVTDLDNPRIDPMIYKIVKTN